MTRSSRDPDAYDQIRDDKLTEQKPEWYVSPDVIGAGMNARLQEQAARIAELEAALAAATVALQLIAAYGTDGICPYGCDTPDIAANALRQPATAGSGTGERVND